MGPTGTKPGAGCNLRHGYGEYAHTLFFLFSHSDKPTLRAGRWFESIPGHHMPPVAQRLERHMGNDPFGSVYTPSILRSVESWKGSTRSMGSGFDPRHRLHMPV
jgi:hypothetical protein